MSAIRVVSGTYRNKPVRNQEFVLVSGFQTGAKGNYVTVKNNGAFPNCPETIRISVDNISDIEYTNGMTQDNTVHFEKPAPVVETDEQAELAAQEVELPSEYVSDSFEIATILDGNQTVSGKVS